MRNHKALFSRLVTLSLITCLFGSAPTIFLPLVSSPEPAPTPEPLPDVYVDDNYSFTAERDESGAWLLDVAGEVVNNSVSPISGIVINTNLLDSQNQVIDIVFTVPTIRTIAPGERTCFDFIFPFPDGYSTFAFDTPTYYKWSNRPELTPADVAIYVWYRYPTAPDVYEFNVDGKIHNDHPTQVQRLEAAATVYKDDKVFDCMDQSDDLNNTISDDIEPGGTGEFSLYALYSDEHASPDELAVTIQVMSYFP